ncbi:MAG: shikimate kinase [Planctomycetes bacterium]|nr:shikimate kinase [Planctomycetota bacterium]
MAPPLRGIVLVGMRGAGKTTVGQLFAKRLGWTFQDLDDHALQRSGLPSIREVFARRGESAWRALEADAIDSLLAPLVAQRGASAVVAVGGGAPSNPCVSAALQRARTDGWRVVWIRTSLPKLVERLRTHEGDRPRLSAEPLEHELAGLDSARRAAYEALADLTVDGDASPDAVASALAASLADALA